MEAAEDVLRIAELDEILSKGNAGFEKWLKKHSVEELQAIIVLISDQLHKDTQGYLDFIKREETIKVCSACRWKHGCERCSFEHALRYAVRNRQPAQWWLKAKGKGMRAGPLKSTKMVLRAYDCF